VRTFHQLVVARVQYTIIFTAVLKSQINTKNHKARKIVIVILFSLSWRWEQLFKKHDNGVKKNYASSAFGE